MRQDFVHTRSVASRAPGWARPLAILIASAVVGSPASAELPAAAEAHMKNAQALLARGQIAAAVDAASAAVASAPDDAQVRFARGRLFDAVRQHAHAEADFSVVITLQPDEARGYHWRGRARFKQGEIDASLADFDRAAECEPALDAHLWERGISYYYAGKYDLGARQFEAYQTVDAADVENVVWRFLCQAKVDGIDRARKALLPLSQPDRRVPLMTVDALFRGNAQPRDVLARARHDAPSDEKRKRRLFYGHLYLALYHAARGERELEGVHIQEAESRVLPDYMWDVAHVHAVRFRQRPSETADKGAGR